MTKTPGNREVPEAAPAGETRPAAVEACLLSAWERVLSKLCGPLLVGKLTPEVVHDINNLLTGILGYAELLNMKPIQDEGVKKGLETISFSAEKCKVLLGRMAALAREESPPVPLGDLHAALEEALELRRCAFRHQQIEVVKDPASNLPPLTLDGLRLQKILLWLFLAAEEALGGREEGRRITIQSRFEPEKGCVSILLIANGFGVNLSAWRRLLTPEGPLTAEDLDGPFWLRQVGLWVEELGGTVELRMEEGEGPIFDLCFPVIR